MYGLSWLGMRGVPPNPQAKMMAYMMPAMMTFFFFRFPAGLNLYYAVQNIAAMPQQWLLSREREKAGVTTPKSGGGGSGPISKSGGGSGSGPIPKSAARR
jgi:YidC/Oxa1 family membrane protein insertase